MKAMIFVCLIFVGCVSIPPDSCKKWQYETSSYHEGKGKFFKEDKYSCIEFKGKYGEDTYGK